MNFKEKIASVLGRILSKEASDIIEHIEIPPDHSLGDYALPCFMFAKELKKSPQQVAEELAAEIKEDYIDHIEVKGPYLNFFLSLAHLAEATLLAIHKEKKDYGKHDEKKTIMIEYSSPNTNKPLHLGHLRNNFLGASVGKLFKHQGHKVILTQIINDRGTHICKSMLAYKDYGEGKTPESEKKKADHFVGDYYVLFNQKLKENPALEEEAQHMLKEWEEGKEDVVNLWKKMNDWIYAGFEETYKSIGSTFDFNTYESEIYKEGKNIILDAKEKGMVETLEDGALAIDLSKEKLGGRKDGKKILLRSDGTSIYIVQDIYLAKKRFDEHPLDQCIYVVGHEQDHHFRTLFTILKKFGYKWAEKLYHLSYGMVYLPEGKMKSREGTVVDADNIVKEMSKLAKEEISKRHPDLSEDEQEERAQQIGLAALKFFLLKVNPNQDLTYDPKESISFDGETGPYIQYSHARAASILRKYGKGISSDVDFSLLNTEHEKELIKMLSRFPEVVREAAKQHKPSLLGTWLIRCAQQFNTFYHECPILNEKESVKKARLLLVTCSKETIALALDLLGMSAPEEM